MMHSIQSLSLSLAPLTSAPSSVSSSATAPPFSITTQFDLIPVHTRTHEPLALRLFCNPLIKHLTKSGACTKCGITGERTGAGDGRTGIGREGGAGCARLAPAAGEHGRMSGVWGNVTAIHNRHVNIPPPKDSRPPPKSQ